MKVAVIVFSSRGYTLGEQVILYFEQNGHTAELTYCEPGGLLKWTKEHFQYDSLIFIGSCGIAVRAVAPFLTSKTIDPAVIVIDESGTYTISLLSGHIGGANDVTVKLAHFLDATPVITTATDIHGIFAIDTWAVKCGLKIANPERIKKISSRLLAGETICVQSNFPLTGTVPPGIILDHKDGDVLISYHTCERQEPLKLIPPIITLGIGCKKNITATAIEHAFKLTLEKAACHPLAIARVCSIDQKAQEPGILEFCHQHSLPYITFSASELTALPGIYTTSAFVKQVTGVDNVCERSAILGSGESSRLLIGKNTVDGITMALAVSPYTICFDEVD